MAKMTHHGTVVGCDSRTNKEPATVVLRETKLYWVDSTGVKYRKRDGYVPGDWPIARLQLETVRPLGEAPPKSDKPLDGAQRWMVARNLEYAATEGVDAVVARLQAQGYNRVANAVAEAVKAQEASIPKESKYQIWPCLSVGLSGHYVVSIPGDPPIFVDGAYHWPKAEAETIAARLNKELVLFLAEKKARPVQDVTDVDFTGKLVRLRDSFFKQGLSADDPKHHFLCLGGFGCKPGLHGTKVFGHFADGEECYIRRSDIVAVIDSAEVKVS